ncbi:Putative uncharacterized protein [Moritella viscosa]|uniref:Uncharacterized protein n=1 Tax=Moritella viscosa TaxID=80854 RepID=A0A1K9ZHW2_9GAMM|nr:Putative uncharacterized protein [Moritella viscosa]SGY97665.1 Putative uncharacterized protein [Moritella viscosa]SGZ03716.1 Putative uncharacterized protein [Moritella viscosa]SGZ04085.1 Putative uncharacterized protein [Moritella viscosa]SHO07788.1 Putative uncharacterized protein [Moritella viscosa]
MNIIYFISADFTLILSTDGTLGHLSVLPLKLTAWLFP